MWSEIVGLLLGLLLGGVGVWFWLRSRPGATQSVASLQKENQQFREEVNQHFVQTAELINQLTDSYKAVFDHLSDGAERLVDQKTIEERMPRVGNQEVRLKRIGSREGITTESGKGAPSPDKPAPADSADSAKTR
ncbi:MAG: ZapG family protein [Wenzhouxiangella sp.]